MKPVTEIAKQLLTPHLQEGDIAIDATAGNGHDTVFLARLVGPRGHVFAFDVQQQAIASTEERLTRENLLSRVTLLNASHEHLDNYIPAHYHGEIKAVMFNLGYLPSASHEVITNADSSTAAIRVAVNLLKPGGLISIAYYIGHAGGKAELAAVLKLCQELEGVHIDHFPGPEDRRNPPGLIVVMKKNSHAEGAKK